MENNVFVTQSGVELELKPVNQLALQNLTMQSGLLDLMLEMDGRDFVSTFQGMELQRQVEISNKMMGLLRYCLMYGVINEPPSEVVEELRVMGVASTPNIARMNWLLSILEDDTEAGQLVAKIREL